MTVSLSVNSAGILEKALTLLHFIFTQQRRVFMPCVPDPDLDPEREKRGRSGEGRPSGFGRFQVQKGPESAAAQRMEKPTAAHNPEVVGSSPAPATTKAPLSSRKAVLFPSFLQLWGTSPFPGHRGDPNRDPYGAKNVPGGGVFASGLPDFFVASDSIRQNFSHSFRRFLLGRGGVVGVGIQGETCREVPQHPGHRLDVHAVLKCQRGERVP